MGEILGREGDMLKVDVKNRFQKGDTLELMTPQGNRKFVLETMHNKKGQDVDVAPGSGHVVSIPMGGDVDPEHALLMRDLRDVETTRKK